MYTYAYTVHTYYICAWVTPSEWKFSDLNSNVFENNGFLNFFEPGPSITKNDQPLFLYIMQEEGSCQQHAGLAILKYQVLCHIIAKMYHV